MVIGIDLGGMSAKAAVLEGGKLYGKSRVVTDAKDSPEATAVILVKLCIQTLQKAGKSLDDVEAIGIGAPGVIDGSTGTVITWSNFGWKDVPLAELVSKFANKPVFVANDANAAALGEAKYGAGQAYTDSVLITIGTGIGGGIIMGGKLFEGFRGAGAELGHMVIRQDGELCSCGRRGCYECYASARALMNLTRQEMERNPHTKLWKKAKTVEDVDGRTVFEALKLNDDGAKRVLDEYITGLGEGVVNIVNLLRPQAVLIGGGVSAEGETLLKPLREYVLPRIYVQDRYAPLAIIAASLGNDAGLFGAAHYALDHFKK